MKILSLQKEKLNKKATTKIFAFMFMGLLIVSCVGLVQGWSNDGFSADPSHPDYGTHDWIAQHALDWLPTQEKQYITDNLAAYLYGTELPDNNNASVPDHIGDTTKHHIYFWANGTLQDDVAADRAAEEYQNALNCLNAGNYSGAALIAGIMSHYIADVAVFAHVMGANTDWGAETGNNHSNYESYVETRTNAYTDTYNSYLLFDGTLSTVSAYDAAKNIAFDTTFDSGGTYTCVWMNNNYDTSNPNSPYWVRAGESLNLAVNTLADVLHTLYLNSDAQPSPTTTASPTPTPTPSATPTPSTTPSPSPTPTPTPSPTPMPSPTPTSTPTPTPTPSPSPTTAPTLAPTMATTQAPIATASPITHGTVKPTQASTTTPFSTKTPDPSPTIPELPQTIMLLIIATIFLMVTLGLVAHRRHNPSTFSSYFRK